MPNRQNFIIETHKRKFLLSYFKNKGKLALNLEKTHSHPFRNYKNIYFSDHLSTEQGTRMASVIPWSTFLSEGQIVARTPPRVTLLPVALTK